MNFTVLYYQNIQYLIAAVAVLLPLFLIVTGRRQLLLGWICLICCIDIFNARIVFFIPAAAVVGLELLPITLPYASKLMQSVSGRAFCLQLGYLTLLAVLFGYVMPWSNYGVVRAFNETAQGRAAVGVMHLLAGCSLALYVADRLRSRADMERLFRWLLAVTTLAAVAALIGYLTRIDLYTTITGQQSQQVVYRLHGLNYEPRGLGLIMAYGIVICLVLLARRFSPMVALALLLDSAALFTAVSLSAIGAMVAALVGLMVFHRRARVPLLIGGSLCLLVVAAVSFYQPRFRQQWMEHFSAHENDEVQQSGQTTWFERLAVRTGPFDAPALLYLRAHPLYMISGAGPELIVLPDTEEAGKLPLYHWLWEQSSSEGIIVPPTLGMVLQVANGGIIGLGLMAVIAIAGWQGLTRLGRIDPIWTVAAGILVGSVCIYVLQASTVSAIPYLMIAPGLAGDRIASRLRVPGPARTSVRAMKVKPAWG